MLAPHPEVPMSTTKIGVKDLSPPSTSWVPGGSNGLKRRSGPEVSGKAHGDVQGRLAPGTRQCKVSWRSQPD